jgi:hypothetical protein
MNRLWKCICILVYSPSLLWAGVSEAQIPPASISSSSSLQWRFAGPVRGGRTEAVAGDVKNPLVFYFGSAHGGVWKTTDAGLYWRNVSDGYFGSSPVGAIDVSVSDPQVIYVGTGEALNRQDIVPGDGVERLPRYAHCGRSKARNAAHPSRALSPASPEPPPTCCPPRDSTTASPPSPTQSRKG